MHNGAASEIQAGDSEPVGSAMSWLCMCNKHTHTQIP